MRRPAILGEAPLVPESLPFVRPLTPPLERVTARLQTSYDRGVLSNGPLVQELEDTVAARLGVRHVVAVASCTSGLILTLAHLRPRGPVVVPSFTFMATAHAVVWNGLRPLFADCDPATFQLDVDNMAARLDGAGAIMATHLFGSPAPAPRIEEVAASLGVPVMFDAAHALGASCGHRPVGTFGDAEVFSLSPTKLVLAGEGGLVATDREDLAGAVRTGRNYGDPGDYDARFVGLNARMSEFHAAMALESLVLLDENLERRRGLVGRYLAALADVPGVTPQHVPPGDVSSYTFFAVTVDEEELGLSRDLVSLALRDEGIHTRSYFRPPVHRQLAYADVASDDLPVTDDLAARVVCLPLYAGLPAYGVEVVGEALASLAAHADEVRQRVGVGALR